MRRIIHWLLVARYWLGCVFYQYEVAVFLVGHEVDFDDWLDCHRSADGWGILVQAYDNVSLYRTVPRWPWPQEGGGE